MFIAEDYLGQVFDLNAGTSVEETLATHHQDANSFYTKEVFDDQSQTFETSVPIGLCNDEKTTCAGAQLDQKGRVESMTVAHKTQQGVTVTGQMEFDRGRPSKVFAEAKIPMDINGMLMGRRR